VVAASRTGRALAAVALTGALGAGGCGRMPSVPVAARPLDPSYQPRHVGRGSRFRPAVAGPALAGHPVAGTSGASLTCGMRPGPRFGVHVEVFAAGDVVLVPAGIGVALPWRRDGVYVRAGRCEYPLATHEPTGLIAVDPRRRFTLGDLFTVWGQALSSGRVADFFAPGAVAVRAYVQGRPWTGDPAAILLTRHATIVVEVGGYVPPHRSYRFPAGL